MALLGEKRKQKIIRRKSKRQKYDKCDAVSLADGRYKCPCGYIYDPANGDPKQNIPVGTKFENLALLQMQAQEREFPANVLSFAFVSQRTVCNEDADFSVLRVEIANFKKTLILLPRHFDCETAMVFASFSLLLYCDINLEKRNLCWERKRIRNSSLTSLQQLF